MRRQTLPYPTSLSTTNPPYPTMRKWKTLTGPNYLGRRVPQHRLPSSLRSLRSLHGQLVVTSQYREGR
uniref:Uncharacterized protein n=1 Tax=Steinernema glaseri TaxID=37863 RepID=A0A1I7YA63_9BILA